MDFLKSYAESIPRGVYSSFIGRQPMSMQNYFRDMYGDFYDEYQAELARTAQAGTLPTLTFADFLGGLDLQKRYGQLTSRQKGFYPATAAPRTRFLNY